MDFDASIKYKTSMSDSKSEKWLEAMSINTNPYIRNNYVTWFIFFLIEILYRVSGSSRIRLMYEPKFWRKLTFS